MIRKVQVELARSTYHVMVGAGSLPKVGRILAPLVEGSRAAVVTDRTVAGIHAPAVIESLDEVGFAVSSYEIAPGEQSKNWAEAGRIVEWLAESGLDRTDVLVAVGGGVVGDLAGFCAATYLRGIAFAQVPTTLLAQVDSSVGGKTAVDLSAGKNLAGAFKQPRVVVADTDTLRTLPEEEWRSGLAEVVKSAVLDSEQFLSWIEANTGSLATRDDAVIAEAVAMSVAFKAGVVASDEFEAGPREALNLGHTLGHAIEKVAGFGVYSHGAAVAEGMRFAARLAERMLGVSPEFTARQTAVLDAVGLTPLLGEFDPDALRLSMSSDKKARGGSTRFVLASAPGESTVLPIPEDVLAEELRAWARERG